jgi:soluble lytic murein transglycosylase-like protein
MRSWIAASLYYQGYVEKADEIAVAATRNGETGVLAFWIAGLIAYREGELLIAHDYFEAMASVPYQDNSLRAAAGFWAARTALAAGEHADVAPNLEIAAEFPFEFYGQLALAQLGREYDHDWSAPMVTEDGLSGLIEAAPRVKRAIALAEAGRQQDADLELRWANGSIPPERDYDLLGVALALKLPAAAIDIALAGDAPYLQAGLFPIPEYAPDDGFKVDRALIYALMRQESKFKTEATSRVGARGLMQLMPRTASYVARDRSLRRRGANGRDRLYDPGFNLRLGQSYVGYLIEGSAEGDLFKLAAAYNGGPGNLRRWSRKMEIEDPLLFIESIPNRESRNFVEHVLTNFWVYRARLGQPAPSRDKVASGELPLYEALDQIAADAN